MYNSVPNGISFPATPPSPPLAAALAGQPGVVPPGAQLPPPPGTPPGMTPDPMASMGGMGQPPDLFQRVAFMMMDPQSKQINPMIAMLFAGIGLARVLEKSGKQEDKAHRSNEELAAGGQPTPNVGQTGMQDPAEMAKGLGGMPGFP